MDIEKVEMKAREVSSKGTHISQLMKPFRAIMAKMSQCDGGRIIDHASDPLAIRDVHHSIAVPMMVIYFDRQWSKIYTLVSNVEVCQFNT